ncbi:substrate-binding periplasmic protein [Dongia deserti]|uniref:substrate-binding periplasmic protein n=1 Tax=Dongia deserti TaxID=2268030 RepID=UPI0013C4F101|nr:transporter substrate-binding domain-containing protein [Dongia deserti]
MIGLLGFILGAGAWVAEGLASQSSLRLACNDFPPHKIAHPVDDGLAGFDVDIISEALKRMGQSVEVSFMPWKRALEMAERGTYDGLCSCSYTKEREAKLLFSDRLGAVSVGLFARNEDVLSGIAAIADLRGHKVATVGGYNLESELIDAGADVEATSSDKNALDMLVAGNVDLFYGYELTTKHFIASDPHTGRIAYKEIRHNPYYFCLSRAMPGAEAAMQGFNQSLSAMAKDGSIQLILDRYHVTFR